MSWKHYTSKELAGLLNVTEQEFHRKIKRMIVRDFKAELKELNVENPDIFLDENNCILLVDPKKSEKYLLTELSIYSYE